MLRGVDYTTAYRLGKYGSLAMVLKFTTWRTISRDTITLEDVDLSLIRLAWLAERALTLSLTGWPEISNS